MGLYFGTDGIRGKVNEDLTQEVCFKCGNSLAKQKSKCKIIIGRDTRTSGSFVLSSFVSGATMAGADIVDVGIIPTPAISFLAKQLNVDYGVMITASHNPPEYNGIKIFDHTGTKISVEDEWKIERGFVKQVAESAENLGEYYVNNGLAKKYINFLMQSIDVNLKGLKIALDCSNGASFFVAGKIFKKLGADVVKIHCKKDGNKINCGCGALYPQKLATIVKKVKADVGFAFDGDADRIVAVTEKGQIVDGDQILLFLTNMFVRFGLLKSDAIVCTIQTNIAIENELHRLGLKLLRTDVGDKFVTQELIEKHLQIGGEQSGHIILTDYEVTGDGILCALQICKFIIKSKQHFSENVFFNLTKQYTKNYVVTDKFAVINSPIIKIATNECESLLSNGRIVVRASGTEPKIRVMIETDNERLVPTLLKKIENAIDLATKR